MLLGWQNLLWELAVGALEPHWGGRMGVGALQDQEQHPGDYREGWVMNSLCPLGGASPADAKGQSPAERTPCPGSAVPAALQV